MAGNQWFLVLTGGLAGAIVAQGIAFLVDLYRRPKLRLTFAPGERGCVVDTPAKRVDAGNVLDGNQRVLRIRVENIGRTTAHGASLCATEITFYAATSGIGVFAEEVLDFRLSLSNQTAFDLPQGLHRFVDIFFAENFAGNLETRFGFLMTPVRLSLLGMGTAGSYSVCVAATAENATVEKKRINWHWDGLSLAGLHIPGDGGGTLRRDRLPHASAAAIPRWLADRLRRFTFSDLS